MKKERKKILTKTNIDRLKIELAHKNYFSDDEYSLFLEESGLSPLEDYEKKRDELYLLKTVIAIFESMSNNVDLYMKIQTEFTTISSAKKALADRIDEIHKRISKLDSYTPKNSVISYLFHN